MNEVQIRVVSAFIAGGLVGGGVVYAVTKNKYRKLAEEEIASVKAEYKRRENVSVKVDTAQFKDSIKVSKNNIDEIINSSYEAKLANLGYADKADLETEGLPTNFDLNEDDEDVVDDPAEWERDFEKPYVINISEFHTEHLDDPKWEKVSLTYYDGPKDDVLASEDGQSITDVEGIIGLANMAHFGVGSDDENILYVRNENIETDFEITRVQGSYTQLALGIDEWNDEDEDKKPVRKMRGDGQ